jgi:putative proteasome-type protease
MTYCVAMRLDEGLVFLADSRTNAGVDHVSTFRKMTVYERAGDRVIVLMTSGNLACGQSVRQLVAETSDDDGMNIWTATSMIRARDAAAMEDAGIDFTMSIVVGGQIGNETCRLFLVYSAGNFIEALAESPYFQIGESKYGKPVLDRMVTPKSTLDEGAKCALVSMDSTMRSNLSVGMPLDLLVYETGKLAVTRFALIDVNNEYFKMIHDTWGERLKAVFMEIPSPVWDAAGAMEDVSTEPTRMAGSQYSTQSEARQPRAEPLRAKLPPDLGAPATNREVQTLAEERQRGPQAD